MVNKEKLVELLKEPKDNFAIYSGNYYTAESSLNDIYMLQKGAKLIKWFNNTTGLIYLPDGNGKLDESIKKNGSIYLQHKFPVNKVFNNENDIDIDALLQFSKSLLDNIDLANSISVQVSFINGEFNIKQSDISNQITQMIVSQGGIVDVKNPFYVISILCDYNDIYLGLSTAKNNISKWALGKTYYSIEFNRAEYKLIESIKYFEIKLDGGYALDIGAAPGGWTKALAKRDYKVWAVDPAKIDEDIVSLDGVTHIRTTTQRFLPTNNVVFDIIVNDMIMDARDSARIMNNASEHLKKTGIAIMTAKLPKKQYTKRLKIALKILKEKYIVSDIKQLPSNKSEVTIFLSNKSD